MTVVIPVGFGQAQFRFQVQGIARECLVVIGYDPPVIDPVANAAALDVMIRQSSRPAVVTSMLIGWSYLGTRVTEMDDTGPLTAEASTLIVGTLTGNPMTPNVAILARKTTALGGRRNRGRIFIPPMYPDEGNVGPAGTIGSTQLTNLQTWWGGMFSAMVAGSLPPVILHSTSPFTPTPVTGFQVQGTVATQRRRLRRQ